jgi:putative endonuclease
MSHDLRHRLGKRGEDLAAAHFERLGFVILERNFRRRWGELDLVARDQDRIVFCEVKTRRVGASSPFESLRERQCHRVRRVAVAWLHEQESRVFAPELRFDAVGVTFDGTGRLVALEHLENAF